MTARNYTHNVHLVDHSGSMGQRADGTSPTKAENATKGVRIFCADQAINTPADGKLTVSLYQFDTEFEKLLDFASGSDPKLATYTVYPRGMTALNDALAQAIIDTGKKLDSMPEDQRPDKVIFVVSTDGLENASIEYGGRDGKARLKAMVQEHTDKYGWVFTFIGADIDAFAESQEIGFAAGATMGTSGTHIAAAYSSASKFSDRVRAGGQAVYTQEERDEAQGKGKEKK